MASSHPTKKMWKIITCVVLLYFVQFISCVDVGSEKKGGASCGQDSNKTTGGFHLNAANFTGECVWSIAPPLLNKTVPTISLFIHFLFLHESDTVTLFKNKADVGNDSLSIIPPLRSQNGSVTIFTQESQLWINLKGNSKVAYQRKFEGMFQGHVCTFPITPDLQIIHSPIHTNVSSSTFECQYVYNKDPHFRRTPSFIFEEFNFNSSEVVLSQSTKDGLYKNVPPIDFFPISIQPVTIDVKMAVPSDDYFRLRMHMVDDICHMYKKFDGHEEKFTVDSPPDVLNNGSITTECRWVFEHSDTSKILGITFDKIHFDNALDIIAINDGASELSPPLFQVTSSNENVTNSQMIRSTGPYLWMAFKPSTYASLLSATVTVHAQGGYHKGNGTISAGPVLTDDTVFLLEVEENKVVYLNFTESDFASPATLSIYDGFDKANLLATLHGEVWYPVLSKSSKMMIIATNFSKGKFTADFKGVTAGCLQMSTSSNENYILSGNCNRTCIWVIPPQDRPGSDLLLNLQFLSLEKEDDIEIIKLDAAKTHLGSISANMNHVPQLMIPASIGALVEVNRGPCSKGNKDIVVVGHSSYLPACGKDLNLQPLAEFQIASPLHPDTYPIFASCSWKISTAKDNLVHLAFHSLRLAPYHCIKITHSSDNKTEQYKGNDLPEDLFLTGESIVKFDSENCETPKVVPSLVSSEGFVLNGTVSDCGSVLSGKPNGAFSVTPNKSLCFWKVSIPETGDDANDIVNIISYTVNKKDDSNNYKLDVYDGSSVRDSFIINDTSSKIWSRTNNLIFIYRKIDATKPSSILTITYDTIKCNDTMQCDNKLCLHPDWRCNGLNDCGDFSDERNCGAVPIPPTVELIGYTSTTFWVTITVMLAIGVGLGVGVPFFYQKYKNGQYRRFGEISIIE